jgi:hypothetical protein
MAARSRRAVALALVLAAALGSTAAVSPTQLFTIKIVWDEVHTAPVFDCENPEVRRRYPAQCPEPPIFISGGPGGVGGGGGGTCGVCDLVRDVVKRIPGVGGLL